LDIGTGIFSGLAFVGLVWLYVATRERWRWRRLIVWGGVLVALPAAAFVGWLYLADYRESLPQLQESFWELQPGITTHEVLFRKGEPQQKSDDYWVYTRKDEGVFYLVGVGSGKVQHVLALTHDGNRMYLPSMQGISNHSTQDEVERKFGKPDAVSVFKDQTRRQLSYMKYGVAFELERNRVISLGVIDRHGKPLAYAHEWKPDAAAPSR
jgi:hypothetical protein